jgi:hypothetical protein
MVVFPRPLMGMYRAHKNRGAVHPALVRLVIQNSVVNNAAVIPNHHVTHPPAMTMYKLDVLAMRM